MANIINFLNRNWFKSLENVMRRHYYPGYQLVDSSRVNALVTKFGSFNFTPALQTYYDLFEQIDTYKLDDLKKSDVVLDIGANIGAFTIAVAKRVDHVIAVEPLFYDELKANVKLNGLENVTCLPFALGTGDSFEISFCNKTKTVQSMKYNDILARCPKYPTFLKIDCEGGEWSTFPEKLTEGIRAVEGEFHNFSYSGRKQDPIRYLDAFRTLGFECNYSWTPEKQLMVSARR